MYGNPANIKHLYNICTMLDQRRRRWANVVQILGKHWYVRVGYIIVMSFDNDHFVYLCCYVTEIEKDNCTSGSLWLRQPGQPSFADYQFFI